MMRDDCELGDPGTVIISLVEDAFSKDMYYTLVSFLIRVSSLSGYIQYNSNKRKFYDTGTWGNPSKLRLKREGKPPFNYARRFKERTHTKGANHTLKHSLHFLETFSKSKSRQEILDRGDRTVWARWSTLLLNRTLSKMPAFAYNG